MRFVLCHIFLLCLTFVTYGQNLAPNSNFENHTSCPTIISSFTASDWTSPFWPGTADYFNICNTGDVGIPENFAGTQESFSGGAYVGIRTHGDGTREFIQGMLLSPTIADETYQLSITYSSSENFGHADGLGMLLSAGAPNEYMGRIPQLEKTVVIDSQTEWHTITYDYLSPGGETHLTIGNFNDESDFAPEGMYQDHAYYYIDSVAVRCKAIYTSDISVDLGQDVQICATDYPYTIVSNRPSLYNEWSTGSTGTSIDVLGPGTYVVRSTLDCRYGTDTVIVSTIPEPTILISDTTICAGEAYTLELDSNLGAYQWSDDTGGAALVVSDPGSYSVTLTSPCGIAQESFTLETEHSLEDADDIIDTYYYCKGESINIDMSTFWKYDVLWDDGSTEKERTIDQPGMYNVQLKNTCIDTVVIYDIKQGICSSETVYIPNIFSPNNDNINDYFSISVSDHWPTFLIKFSIYDRWGQLIFYTEDPDFTWDGTYNGTLLNPNLFVYAYEIEFEINGVVQSFTGSGDITIVR